MASSEDLMLVQEANLVVSLRYLLHNLRIGELMNLLDDWEYGVYRGPDRRRLLRILGM